MLAALPEAAKKEMPLFGQPCADPAPALEMFCVAENSRQGFRVLDSTLRLASSGVKTSITLGIRGTLYGAGIRSRCTGKERDTETGNDYFGARYYNASMGRWLSPDWSAAPEPIPYADLSDPQSLNLYGYVRNRPTFSVDPLGHVALGGSKDDSLDQIQRLSIPAEAFRFRRPCICGDNTQAAVQVAKDTVIGGAKGLGNTAIDFANAINQPIDGVLSNFTRFRFGQMTPFQGATPGERNAMAGIFIGGFLVGTGEESAALKIESLTADAEKLYPKLAGKLQDHHIVPKYLAGAADGETSTIPAAYHQLITNEFRGLAPYGQSSGLTLSDIGKIIVQVYSKFPLP